MMAIIEIELTSYEKGCPYCKKRPLKHKTCGHPICQYYHHIHSMRTYPRKTDQKRHTATISTTQL